MDNLSDRKGADLLSAVLEELKGLDPKIVPHDSAEVQELEAAVVRAVKEIFGEGSPEYGDFENFSIAEGPVSRADSRMVRQSKYEAGLPRAAARIQALLEAALGREPAEDSLLELAPEELEVVGGGTARAGTPAKVAPDEPLPAARAGKRTSGTKRAPAAAKAPPTPGPGNVLMLQAGGDEIALAVTALLDKVGIDVAVLDEETPEEVESVTSGRGIGFALLTVSPGIKGGLSGLTSVIAKPRPKHEFAFKLGLLVGRLGPGRVAVLFAGERPMDIPEDLHGIRYLPYQEDGGWQIGMLKMLKASGYTIDANLLFE